MTTAPTPSPRSAPARSPHDPAAVPAQEIARALGVSLGAPMPDAPRELERLALAEPGPTLVPAKLARLTRWLRGGPALRVVCAHDLSRAGDAALAFAARLAALGRCETTIVHVHRTVETVAPAGCQDLGSKRRHDLEVRAAITDRLTLAATAALGEAADFQVRVSAAPFQRDDFILDVIRADDADVVLAPVHSGPGEERGDALPTTSWTLLRFAGTNVVLVPRPGAASGRAAAPAARRVLIVLELDGGDDSRVAVGNDLVGTEGSLRLVHVVPASRHGGAETDPPHVAQRRERADVIAARWRARGERDVEAEVLVAPEEPLGVAAVANRFEADLVVVGSRERDGGSSIAVRRRLEALLRAVRRPLLVWRASDAGARALNLPADGAQSGRASRAW